MNWPGKAFRWSMVAVLSILPGCCSTRRPIEVPPSLSPSVPARNSEKLASLDAPSSIQPVALTSPESDNAHAAPDLESDVFTGMTELTVDTLVRQVLDRNPSLAQMVAAWQAASARYPQVTSLDDPMLAVTLGPATFGSNTVNPAYRINLEQRIPFPGKLKLRGKQAAAAANAAGNDVDDMRLQLIESAKNAFYEYYLVHRASAVNNEGIRLLEEFRKNALARFKAGQAPQQDILQADVELGRQRERALLLEQTRQIAVARINTLVSLPPGRPLPLPPTEIQVANTLPGVDVLRAAALARRPDLQALSSRIEADQAALALANKEFCPDFTPFAMYDRFMGNNAATEPLATMLGMSVNLPVRRDRRFAAVAEAQARLAERRAELNKQLNQVHFEVQQAYSQVQQTEKAVHLYDKTVLPAAKANINAATAAYATGKINFLSLLEAERNLIGLRDRYYELLASYHSRQATLERVVGGPLGPPSRLTEPPDLHLPQPRELHLDDLAHDRKAIP